MAPLATPRELRYRDRLILAMFGFFVAGIAGDTAWGGVARITGWLIVAAAIGVVELAMASYYWARHRLR
jgi:hypothetical protein